MARDFSLLSSLDVSTKKKIYVADDFPLDIVGHGYMYYRHGQIVNVYHVPNISENLLSISQLAPTGKIVEFQPNCFFFKDLKKYGLIIIEGVINSKE